MRPTIHITPRRTVGLLAAVLVGLVAIQLVITFCHLVLRVKVAALTNLFDMNREGNVPTLFNVLLFFLVSALFLMIARSQQGRPRWPWLLLAAMAGFLGIDEGSEIHEHFTFFTIRSIKDGTLDPNSMRWVFFAWTIPYVLVFGAILGVLIPWLVRLERRVRNGLFLAGSIYLLGAVVTEIIGGHVAADLLLHAPPDSAFGWLPCEAYTAGACFLYNDPLYVGLYTLEETLEMTGVIVAVGALLGHVGRLGARINMVFVDEGIRDPQTKP